LSGYQKISAKSSYTASVEDYGTFTQKAVPKFSPKLLAPLNLHGKPEKKNTYKSLLSGNYSYIMMPKLRTTLLALPLRANSNRGFGRRELTVDL
jgi:hypothetical protein